MTENAPQPNKSARAADALDAMFRGEQASPDAQQTIDGVQVSATPADLVRADSTDPSALGASPPVSAAMGYSDPLAMSVPSTGGPAPRRRRTIMSPGWRYAIPVLAGMATLMGLMALWALGALIGLWSSKIKNNFMVVLLLVACLLFAVFFVFSCYVISSELRRQEQNRNRAATAAAQRTNPPAAP